MKREDLVDLTDEQKEMVMSLYGKAIAKKDKEVESLNNKVQSLENKIGDYETKIEEISKTANEGADWKLKFEELQTSMKEKEAQEKAQKEDEILTNNINALFEGKTFTSDYAKNGLLNDIKTGLNKPENKGKGIQDLFDELTKDKSDIFKNPNEMKDMEGMGDSEQDNNVKEMPLIW